MRKNRIGLCLIDMDDSMSELPEVWNQTADRLQEIIEQLRQEMNELRQEARNNRYDWRGN